MLYNVGNYVLTTKARTRFFFFNKVFVLLLALEPATLERPARYICTCAYAYEIAQKHYSYVCKTTNDLIPHNSNVV